MVAVDHISIIALARAPQNDSFPLGPATLARLREGRPEPGKRYAIGTALRAMAQGDVATDDVAVFMDGDSRHWHSSVLDRV